MRDVDGFASAKAVAMGLVSYLSTSVAPAMLDVLLVAHAILGSGSITTVRGVVTHSDVVQSFANILSVALCMVMPFKFHTESVVRSCVSYIGCGKMSYLLPVKETSAQSLLW